MTQSPEPIINEEIIAEEVQVRRFERRDARQEFTSNGTIAAAVMVLAAILAVVGHSKPIYFGFKGGKGVLVAAGAILAVQPVLLPVLALIFLVCLVPTGMVSLGSITMAAAYPVLTLVYSLMRGLPTRDVVVCTVGAAIMGGMVIWMHRSNIQRIRDGKEYRFGQKHKSN